MYPSSTLQSIQNPPAPLSSFNFYSSHSRPPSLPQVALPAVDYTSLPWLTNEDEDNDHNEVEDGEIEGTDLEDGKADGMLETDIESQNTAADDEKDDGVGASNDGGDSEVEVQAATSTKTRRKAQGKAAKAKLVRRTALL